jgi:hypothetical protein
VVGRPADRRKWKELVSMGNRPLAALTSLVVAVLGVVFLFPPDCASACSCAISGSQEERAERALAKSSAVFSGEVVGIEQGTASASDPGSDTITLRASEVWKGTGLGTLEVRTPSQGIACGYHFEEGREYLVYAYGKRGLEVDLCTETKPLSEAGADLALLGDGEKPQDGEVLSDTSGGVSGRAMVGFAGLALAASLLLMVRLVRTGQM